MPCSPKTLCRSPSCETQLDRVHDHPTSGQYRRAWRGCGIRHLVFTVASFVSVLRQLCTQAKQLCVLSTSTGGGTSTSRHAAAPPRLGSRIHPIRRASPSASLTFPAEEIEASRVRLPLARHRRGRRRRRCWSKAPRRARQRPPRPMVGGSVRADGKCSCGRHAQPRGSSRPAHDGGSKWLINRRPVGGGAVM